MKTSLILFVLLIFATPALAFEFDYAQTLQAFAYSKVSYCKSKRINKWDCGKDCKSLPDV